MLQTTRLQTARFVSLTPAQQRLVRDLARQGLSIKGIARELGIARNTVRRYVRGLEEGVNGGAEPRAVRLD